MLNQIRASIAKAIAPRVSLSVIGTELPQVQLLSQPITPSASAPGDLVRSNPAELAGLVRAIHGVSQAMKAGRPAAALPGRAAPARPAPRAAAPSSTDDDAPQPDTSGLDSVIKSLMDSVEQLKKMLPADVDADDGDLATAKAFLATGDKKAALAAISKAHTAVGAQVAALKSSNALRSQPSSRKRASALIRQGFDAQPVVANLDAMFHRPAARASLALAPVGGSAPARPTAVVTTTSTAEDVARIRSIEAEIKNIDADYRKTGVYSPDAQARHATLSRQLSAAKKKFHVS